MSLFPTVELLRERSGCLESLLGHKIKTLSYVTKQLLRKLRATSHLLWQDQRTCTCGLLEEEMIAGFLYVALDVTIQTRRNLDKRQRGIVRP